MGLWDRKFAIPLLKAIELFPKRTSALESITSRPTISGILKEAVLGGLAEKVEDGYILTDAGRVALAAAEAVPVEAKESESPPPPKASAPAKPSRNLAHFEKWLVARLSAPVSAAELPGIVQEKFAASDAVIQGVLLALTARGIIKLSNLPDGTPAYVITEQEIKQMEADVINKSRLPYTHDNVYKVIEALIIREQKPVPADILHQTVYDAMDMSPYEHKPPVDVMGTNYLLNNCILGLGESGRFAWVWSRSTREDKWGLRHGYLSSPLRGKGKKVPELKMEDGWQEPYPVKFQDLF